jgi:hypothetical protein
MKSNQINERGLDNSPSTHAKLLLFGVVRLGSTRARRELRTHYVYQLRRTRANQRVVVVVDVPSNRPSRRVIPFDDARPRDTGLGTFAFHSGRVAGEKMRRRRRETARETDRGSRARVVCYYLQHGPDSTSTLRLDVV